MRGKDLKPRKVRDPSTYRVAHGHARRGQMSPEYISYHGMLHRCYDPKNKRYADYGGRGIIVCDRWQESFQAFVSDMGVRPSSKHSIDRIDNDGNYEPENCRWATNTEQSRNRRNRLPIWHHGQHMTGQEYCELTGLSYATFQHRLYILNWPLERALSLEDGRKRPAAKRALQGGG